MNRPFALLFHPSATKEYLEAIDWYNERSEGLGDTFFDTVLDTSQQIAEMPLLYQSKTKGYREALVPGFPYVLLYRIKPRKREVEIMAVFHTSRNPRKKLRK